MKRNNIIYFPQQQVLEPSQRVDAICQVALTVTEIIVTTAIGFGTLGCLLIFLSLYY